MAATAAATTAATTTVREAAHRIERLTAQTRALMQALRQHTDQNRERVEHLGRTFSQIESVVSMIATIADQTRMIAFNASIEAAGAGESGGRFSIVATEVRRLANTVVDALNDIQELVNSIQAVTNELTLASEHDARSVNQGTTLIDEMHHTIGACLEELEALAQTAQTQAQATRQHQDARHALADSMREMVAQSQTTEKLGVQASDAAAHMQRLVAELDEIVRTFHAEAGE